MTERNSLVGDSLRPEMLVSGEVHGDEVVGPQVVVAYIEFMARAYASGDPHVRRMLKSRIVTLVPTANAIGYELGLREEIQDATPNDTRKVHVGIHGHHGHHAEHHVHLDPNRDFAFDNHPKGCMRTLAGRVINELVRERMFRLLITFHGGTNVIGYEWGDTAHCRGRNCSPAPDLDIMRRLALRMRDSAGTAGNFEPEYRVGNMGATVYPVKGGMEDWAYGASWAGQGLVCTPDELGGYPPEKTTYTPAMTRAITYLVETGMTKRPYEVHLGGDAEPMKMGGKEDGHVPRNMRLLNVALDALDPYVTLEERGRVAFSSSNDKQIKLTWRVGGAFVVDGTYLQWGTKSGHDGTTKVLRGTAGNNGTLFVAHVPFNSKGVSPTDTLYVRAAAVADNSLDKKIHGASPSMLPQSHLLAARARSGWKHRIGGRVVMARRLVYSPTVRIQSYESYVKVQVVKDVKWGAGTGRIPAPSYGTALRTLYPGVSNSLGVLGLSWDDITHMSIKSWGFLVLLCMLWAVPCCVFYRNRCWGKQRSAQLVSVYDPEDSKDGLLDEEILS